MFLTPLPGAASGPDPLALGAVAASYGLTCQPSQSGTGEAETFCIRNGGAGGLILTATWYSNPALVVQATAAAPAPLPPEADTFMHDIAATYCLATQSDAISALVAAAKTAGQPGTSLEDDTCRVEAFYYVTLSAPGIRDRDRVWQGHAGCPAQSHGHPGAQRADARASPHTGCDDDAGDRGASDDCTRSGANSHA